MNPLARGVERITGNLVVPDVRTELNEALVLFLQDFEIIRPLDFDIEGYAGIHREFINHHLRKQAVVSVRHPASLQNTIVETGPEESIGRFSNRAEHHAERDDKDIRKQIQDADIDHTKDADEIPMHPSVAKCRAHPLAFRHFYFSFVSI